MSPAYRASFEDAAKVLETLTTMGSATFLSCDLPTAPMTPVSRYQDTTDAYLVALAHRLEQFASAFLVLLHRVVPHGVELLELEHVGLLDTQALRNLPRAQTLLTPALLVLSQLLKALPCNLRLHILAAPLAVLHVLLKDREEVRHRGAVRGLIAALLHGITKVVSFVKTF
jgi:hypothetical protein